MKNGIHFISGLPRSGSTLLSGILLQNPQMYAGVTSPLHHMVSSLHTIMSAKNEYYHQIDNAQRQAVLRSVFESFYGAQSATRTIFDTGRAWTGKLPLLAELFPEARTICCVRSVAWIIDSIERITRLNALEPSGLFNFESTGNVYSRCDALNSPSSGLIGVAFASLKEAFYGEFSQNILLVTYESLTRQPERVMDEIYAFLGKAPFPHDFQNIEYGAEKLDETLGLPGLHRVGGAVRYTERVTVLPPDIFRKFDATSFWTDPSQNPRGVKII